MTLNVQHNILCDDNVKITITRNRMTNPYDKLNVCKWNLIKNDYAAFKMNWFVERK